MWWSSLFVTLAIFFYTRLWIETRYFRTNLFRLNYLQEGFAKLRCYLLGVIDMKKRYRN